MRYNVSSALGEVSAGGGRARGRQGLHAGERRGGDVLESVVQW